MAVPSPSPTKAELRAEGLRRRREYAASLTPELRRADEVALAYRVVAQLALENTIALYSPLPGEINPLLIADIVGSDLRCVLPWFADREAPMLWRTGRATERGPWNVLQPSNEGELLFPDLVVVPIVLADRHGIRIGHGKGHYDRALTLLRERGGVRAIGVCWDWQVVDESIPADPWDVRLDAVATPKEWIKCA